MSERLDALLDDYAARFARGESPDVRDYVERAGDEGPALAGLIDRFLQAAPPPAPRAEHVAMFEAWLAGETPLLELRRRRGRTREAVVDALMGRLELDPAKREKVAEHYHRLESGLLRVGRVDERVVAVIARALDARPGDLAFLAPRHRPEALGFAREAEPRAAALHRALAAPPLEPLADREREPDEVDRLFGAGG